MRETAHMNGFVALDRVSKDFKGFKALDDVSFQMEEGEILGYVGPNGAGKTTTIKAIVGLMNDFQGTITIGGHRMPRDKKEVHKLLGYLPQSVAFQEWRTVDHALTSFGLLSGMERSELDGRIEEVLKIVGLSEFRHKKISELSGGNVQKVGLAQALLHHPKLLVLDEPLAGLDPASRYNLKRTIKGLANNGTTIFFSSHILSDVQDVASRIGIISRGRVLQVGTLDELKSEFSAPTVISFDFSVDPGRTEELGSVPNVAGIEQPSANKMFVHIDDGTSVDETAHIILQHMMELGYHVRSMAPVSPSLDELYIRYVGGECQ